MQVISLQLNLRIDESSRQPQFFQLRLHRMTEPLERIEPLLEHDSFSCDGSSSCELLLLEVIEYLLALLFVFVGEEQTTMPLEILHLLKGTSVIL